MAELCENSNAPRSSVRGVGPHNTVSAAKALYVFAGLLTATLAASPAAAQEWGEMWHGSWGWGHMVAGGLMMILFWTAIIFLVVLLARWLAGSGNEPGYRARPQALEILEERFARGEIDRQEFEEKKALLARK